MRTLRRGSFLENGEMTNLMQRISLANDAFQVAVPIDVRFDIAMQLPELKVADEASRALEAELANRIANTLTQYNDGLIPASELITKLILEAYKEEGANNLIKNESQRISYDPITNCLDVTGAINPEIRIRWDDKVVWVNEGGRCLLRICQIKGAVEVQDERK